MSTDRGAFAILVRHCQLVMGLSIGERQDFRRYVNYLRARNPVTGY